MLATVAGSAVVRSSYSNVLRRFCSFHHIAFRKPHEAPETIGRVRKIILPPHPPLNRRGTGDVDWNVVVDPPSFSITIGLGNNAEVRTTCLRKERRGKDSLPTDGCSICPFLRYIGSRFLEAEFAAMDTRNGVGRGRQHGHAK
jgi:hypothetical protein